MAETWRSIDLFSWVSDELRDAVRRRVWAIGGFALVGLATGLGLALATWSVQDPSLTHATKAPVRNLLGTPGAIASDLLMQLIGLATIALLLPVAIWGWRLISNRPIDRERWRVLFWVLGVLMVAAFASALPPSPRWPLPSGLGGVLGDALLRVPGYVMGWPLSELQRTLIASVTGGIGAVALFLAAGFGWRRREDDAEEDEIAVDYDDSLENGERGWLLGWLAHALLAARLRVGWLIGWIKSLFKGRDEFDALANHHARAGERIEPRWRDAPPVALAPDEAPILLGEVEEEIEEEPAPARAPKKPEPAPRAAAKRGDGYELPPLSLLAAAKPVDRPALSEAQIKENARLLEGVLDDFDVRGRDRRVAPRPGGDDVRAGAGARHQGAARDRARRRYRPQHVGAVGARRRDPGPQRDRHRTAQPEARDGAACASCWQRADLTDRPAPRCR